MVINQTRKTAIILAAGSGTRAGYAKPKQLQILNGVPVFMHSIRRFLEVDPDTKIILVINKMYVREFKLALETEMIADSVILVNGGSSRLESVANAIAILNDDDEYIAIHDSARPLVSCDLIRRGWEAVNRQTGVVSVVPLTDSIRKRNPDGTTMQADRSDFVAVQTPQVFPADMLTDAYSQLKVYPENILSSLTDDASVVQKAGNKIVTCEGDYRNMKITGPNDLCIAEALIKNDL